MVWYAAGIYWCVDVVDSPVVTFKLFMAGNTAWFQYAFG